MFDQLPSFWKVSFIVSGVKPLKFNTVYLLQEKINPSDWS